MPTPRLRPPARRLARRFAVGSACGLMLTAGLLGCEVDRTSRNGAAPGRSEFHSNWLTGPPDLPDLAQPSTDADMTPGLDCKAAAGLPGTRLLCIDFDTATAPNLSGWQLAVGCTATHAWEVGKLATTPDPDPGTGLQEKSYATLGTVAGERCGFSPPPINLDTHQSVTLSIEHWVDLPPLLGNPPRVPQVAEIYPTQSAVVPRWATFHGQDPRVRRFTLRIRRADLQSDMFAPLFSLWASSSAGNSYAGWRIKSIAVLGE